MQLEFSYIEVESIVCFHLTYKVENRIKLILTGSFQVERKMRLKDLTKLIIEAMNYSK